MKMWPFNIKLWFPYSPKPVANNKRAKLRFLDDLRERERPLLLMLLVAKLKCLIYRTHFLVE